MNCPTDLSSKKGKAANSIPEIKPVGHTLAKLKYFVEGGRSMKLRFRHDMLRRTSSALSYTDRTGRCMTILQGLQENHVDPC